uniref:EF-hand domain-containing protein n=1 Tax=Angiostrongylus cantonensis TaxID=6313 RepID=A0A0K0DKJ0_ANGCA
MKLSERETLMTWPPLLNKREIQDMVHGPISLFHPLDRLVDTREFQRLRDIKQLGVTYMVYPCCTHSRFVHSLGLVHESLSIALLRRLIDRTEIRATLENYLGTGEEFQNNITFIEELILSEKFDLDGSWLPKGRPLEKAFLFDIVANDNDSIDVDKFDYLIRDSICAGVPIPFDRVGKTVASTCCGN